MEGSEIISGSLASSLELLFRHFLETPFAVEFGKCKIYLGKAVPLCILWTVGRKGLEDVLG